ncbi:MAG: cell division protein ZipA C-terminal FtsZ-binding domain-containing protein [Methylotenera sp.]|nr:cell division protein ZipA C-terminal FtsZ-binding domain-containing protein [Methylotenera sp.]
MSDLQIILIVIGVLIICAVVVINWWQERRFHKQVESSFSPLQSDALLDNPKLDINSVYQSLDDADVKDFSIKNAAVSDRSPNALNDDFQGDDFAARHVSNNESGHYNQPTHAYTTDEAYLEEESIDTVYTRLEQTKSKGHDISSKFIDPDFIDPEFKDQKLGFTSDLAQHEDIKAIFSEAFSQTTNTTSNYKYEEDEPTATKAHEEMATYGDVKVEEPVEALPAMLHSQIDLTALLYLAQETPLSSLKSALTGLLQGYDKPVFVHVLDDSKIWHDLDKAIASLPITRVACSLQLADRGGPASRQALNRFQLAVEAFGLDINAHVEWQSPGDAYTTATALDSFCIEVDKTMGFHLAHGENGAFTGTKLRGLAEAQGLTLDADGAFKFFDDSSHKHPSFVMVNRDVNPFSPEMLRSSVVKGVTFQLDIPHVKQCAEAFNHMVQIARQMEIGLNATLVDDNNRVLGDILIEKIRQQLKVIHATMLVRGIIPGSDSAHRLFS